MPGESDNNERILYTSESVGEGHPGKYGKYLYEKYMRENIPPSFATLRIQESQI